jgi:hypothetical protein
MWKIYKKAGQPGWASIVPFYNTLVLLKIVGRPWWWIVLMLIPFVNLVVAVIVLHDLSKSFGKGAGTTVLMALLPFIAAPMLGFGSATYQGPSGPERDGTPTTPAAPTTPVAPTAPTTPTAVPPSAPTPPTV